MRSALKKTINAALLFIEKFLHGKPPQKTRAKKRRMIDARRAVTNFFCFIWPGQYALAVDCWFFVFFTRNTHQKRKNRDDYLTVLLIFCYNHTVTTKKNKKNLNVTVM